MLGRTLYSEVAFVVGLTVALPLWAKPLKKYIELYSPARVGNETLKAGQYELIFHDKTATFEKDNKVVAEIPYQMVRITKPPTDEVLFDKDKLSELEFAGKSIAIEFTDDQAPVSSPPSSSGNR